MKGFFVAMAVSQPKLLASSMTPLLSVTVVNLLFLVSTYKNKQKIQNPQRHRTKKPKKLKMQNVRKHSPY